MGSVSFSTVTLPRLIPRREDRAFASLRPSHPDNALAFFAAGTAGPTNSSPWPSAALRGESSLSDSIGRYALTHSALAPVRVSRTTGAERPPRGLGLVSQQLAGVGGQKTVGMFDEPPILTPPGLAGGDGL